MNNTTYAQIKKNLEEENTYQVIADCKRLSGLFNLDIKTHNKSEFFIRVQKKILLNKKNI